MPERFVTPLPDFIIKHPETGEDAKDADDPKRPAVAEWKKIMLRLLDHPRMTANLPAIKSCNLLRRKIRASTVGEPFSVPEEDWQRLVGVINDPDAGLQKVPDEGTLAVLVRMIRGVLPQLEDYFSAWTDAPSKRPEAPAAAPPAGPPPA